jgi:hypothetical protein
MDVDESSCVVVVSKIRLCPPYTSTDLAQLHIKGVRVPLRHAGEPRIGVRGRRRHPEIFPGFRVTRKMMSALSAALWR